MKTILQTEEAAQKRLDTKKKLKVGLHRFREHSVTSYEVHNAFGIICGGNLARFIPYVDLRKFDYPKVFFSSKEGQHFIDNDYRAALAYTDIDDIMGINNA